MVDQGSLNYPILMLASIWLALVYSAALEAFPNYQGDRDNLAFIQSIIGTVPLPDEATCLDNLLPMPLLISLVNAAEEFNLERIGRALQELSTDRFDALCDRLPMRYRFDSMESFCPGYGKKSRWVLAYDTPSDAEITTENAEYHRRQSRKVCDFMEKRPGEILTERQRSFCVKYWLNEKKNVDLV